MFFIIAGVSPRVKKLETSPRICPNCGLAQAYLSRVDHYLNLFFIPVLRVKKGEPGILCERCRTAGYDVRSPAGTPSSTRAAPMCRQCGRILGNDFLYCPYCGAKNP